jgi:hypothetical protein
MCAKETRQRVLATIIEKLRNGPPVCRLYGPAGAGKTTIAHTISKLFDDEELLAFSCFFSRRSPGRNNIRKFLPSFAYQLACSIPSIHDALQLALRKRNIFDISFRDQCKALIATPLKSIKATIQRHMVVVIDGLDEYPGEDSQSKTPLKEVIDVLIESLSGLPIRILFTSRSEHYINVIFESFPSDSVSHTALMDFETQEEVHKYLFSELVKVREERGLPTTWPAEDDILQIARKSEGYFIYARTAISFVNSKYSDPREMLKKALDIRGGGLYPLYHYIVDEAKKYAYFDQVIGAVLVLRAPLTPSDLARLLRLDIDQLHLGLRGCASTIFIPDDSANTSMGGNMNTEDSTSGEYSRNTQDNSNHIRPYHASFMDFLTDKEHAKEHYRSRAQDHTTLVRACVKTLEAWGPSQNGSTVDGSVM